LSAAFVADSSVGLAWAVPGQANQATDELLANIGDGRAFVVPVLWPFEIANALVVLYRRKRIGKQDWLRARLALEFLHPKIDETGPFHALSQISELAEKHALSAYDAAYLELALRLKAPLASRDAALNRAARLDGVETLV
jgi:predicted nucleic acid-binding protein